MRSKLPFDNLLQYVGITRDEAEQIPETASGIVGINYNNPDGKKFFDYWEAELCDAGMLKMIGFITQMRKFR